MKFLRDVFLWGVIAGLLAFTGVLLFTAQCVPALVF